MNWEDLMNLIEKGLHALCYGDGPVPPYMQPAPVQPIILPTVPPAPPQPLLQTFCEGIKFREGANPANHNEGNCKYNYGGYLPMYGKVGRSVGGFAIFETDALGHLYLQNLIKGIIHKHPTLSFYTFFAGDGSWPGYAPKIDNNDPLSYSTQVATRCGHSITDLVSVILS